MLWPRACVLSCPDLRALVVEELAQVFVAEAGWRAHRSHAGMAHVLGRYARDHEVSLVDAADGLVWAHSNAMLDRPWIRYLREDCERPDYFEGLWPLARCRELFARATDFLAGRLTDPCRGKATGWRTRGKALRRALARGHQRVRCVGGTSVAFVRAA